MKKLPKSKSLVEYQVRFNVTNKFQGIKLKAKSVDVAASSSAELQSSSLNSLFIEKCKH